MPRPWRHLTRRHFSSHKAMELSTKREILLMTKTYSTHTPLWSVRLLCLLLAGLTACSASRPQYAWTDRGAQGRREVSKAPPVMETWGADAEGPNTPDPTIVPGFLLT